MQRFSNSNVFVTRSNRFRETGPLFKTKSINSIELGIGFESNNDKEDYFTNFLNSEKQDNYVRMCRLYNQIVENDLTFINKDYMCDEIYDNGRVVDRLIKIINYKSGLVFTKKDISHIFKLKNKDNKRLHIYISLCGEKAEIVLIDLYHLSMPADIWKNKRIVKKGSLDETKRMYGKYESYKFNLNNIITHQD